MTCNAWGNSMSTRTLTVALIASMANSAWASFHLFAIDEFFTSPDGAVQFIEMFSSSGSQQFLNGNTITASDVGNTQSHIFTFGSNLPGDSANHHVLIATAGFGSLPGGVTPDYTLPANFLFLGGSVTLNGANQGSVNYAAMPNDGIQSFYVGGPSGVNSPMNYGGQGGSVVVPEAKAGLLFGLGALFLVPFRARRLRICV